MKEGGGAKDSVLLKQDVSLFRRLKAKGLEFSRN